MKVRCIGTRLSTELQEQLKIVATSIVEYQIVLGHEYLVLGITFILPSEPHGGGVHYQILNDFGACRSIPASLFELTDPRCSRHWYAQHDSDGSLMLWPKEFFNEFFHDDLSEGLFDATETFKKVTALLISEFQ